MKKYCVILLIVLVQILTGVSFAGGEKKMNKYYYPYCNRQLNSLLSETCSSTGRLYTEIQHVTVMDNFTRTHSKTRNILLVNDKYLLIEMGTNIIAIDIHEKKIIGIRKNAGEFIFIKEESAYHFISFDMYPINFDEFSKIDEQNSFMLTGPDGSVVFFYHEGKTYIKGVNTPPNPRNRNYKFRLYKTKFNLYEPYLFEFKTQELFPLPMIPLSVDNKIIVAQKSLITVLDLNGKILNRIGIYE